MNPNLKQRIHNAWNNLKTHDKLSLVVHRLEKHAKSNTRLTFEQNQQVMEIRDQHLKAKEALEQELEDRMKEVNIKFASQELEIYDIAQKK